MKIENREKGLGKTKWKDTFEYWSAHNAIRNEITIQRTFGRRRERPKAEGKSRGNTVKIKHLLNFQVDL